MTPSAMHDPGLDPECWGERMVGCYKDIIEKLEKLHMDCRLDNTVVQC